MNQGFSGETILSQVHDRIVKDDSITTLQKAKISQLLGTADINLVHGSDEHLQVLNVLMGISSILAEK